jgi:NADPH-dependent ferric siderophore reductase
MAEERAQRRRKLTRLEVLRTEWLSPHMVRVVAGGPGLADFAANDFTDQYVKLQFRRPGVEYPEPFDPEAVRRDMPRAQWPVVRTYTVRYHRPELGELAIDFVHHGDEGVAAPWAAGAKPGDEMVFFGPSGAYSPSPEADWHLLAGDEAALPAISVALEQIPAGVPVLAFIEVAGPAEQQPLASPGEATISWLHRGAAPVGERLLEAVRGLRFPPGVVQAFVHGETGTVKALRRHLLDERRLDRHLLSISGYWRLGMDEDGFQAQKRAEKEKEAGNS